MDTDIEVGGERDEYEERGREKQSEGYTKIEVICFIYHGGT